MSEPELNILELFNKAAGEVIGKTFPDATYQTTIAELGIDSVSITEMVARIEDALHVRIPDETFMEIRTVGDIADAVAKLRRQKR